jgi:hypothetical protein
MVSNSSLGFFCKFGPWFWVSLEREFVIISNKFLVLRFELGQERLKEGNNRSDCAGKKSVN